MSVNLKVSKFPSSQILLYTSLDGQTKVEVKLDQETVWLSQAQIAELFQKTLSTISEHIKNIYEEAELEKELTIRKFRLVRLEGSRKVEREIDYYNLDIIISVGYRVKSLRGTQFRIWATKQLKEYLIKGFVLDDKRLAEGKTVSGISYFEELLDRVRAIRASEKNLYQKVRDIFATSIDYSSQTDEAKEFYGAMQNKFHFAVTGKTTAELVVHRIDGKKPYLGMTNWQGQKPKTEEAKIAKNYMLKAELEILYLLVEQFLSFAELQIKLQRPMYMKDWKSYLHDFLKLNKLQILKNKGSISHQKMEKVVKKEMQRFLEKDWKKLIQR